MQVKDLKINKSKTKTKINHRYMLTNVSLKTIRFVSHLKYFRNQKFDKISILTYIRYDTRI